MPTNPEDVARIADEIERLDRWIARAMKRACGAFFYQAGLWKAVFRAAHRRDDLRHHLQKEQQP